MGGGPWWGAPLFTLLGTLGGVLITLVGALWVDRRQGAREAGTRAAEHRRESRFRWVAHKRELYSRHLVACRDLAALPVWPPVPQVAPDPVEPLVARIAETVAQIDLVADGEVVDRARATATAAQALATDVTAIRAGSKPGHQGQIEARLRDGHRRVAAAFTAALDAFLAAARRDLDVSPDSADPRPSPEPTERS